MNLSLAASPFHFISTCYSRDAFCDILAHSIQLSSRTRPLLCVYFFKPFKLFGNLYLPLFQSKELFFLEVINLFLEHMLSPQIFLLSVQTLGKLSCLFDQLLLTIYS